MLDSESIKTMFRPLLIFVVLMVGVTALLQKTLILFKLGGAYTHWAVILLVLPVLIGLLLSRMETEEPLFIVIAGALLSTIALYFLYKHYFWAQAPKLLNGLFFFAVVAGCAHIPFSQQIIERFLDRIEQIRKARRKARRASKSNSKTSRTKKEPSMLTVIFSHENTIPLIEMSVGIISLLLSVYSIAFMGKG